MSVEGLGLTPFGTPPNAIRHKSVNSALAFPLHIMNVLLVCLAWPFLRYALCYRVRIIVICAKSNRCARDGTPFLRVAVRSHAVGLHLVQVRLLGNRNGPNARHKARKRNERQRTISLLLVLDLAVVRVLPLLLTTYTYQYPRPLECLPVRIPSQRVAKRPRVVL